MGWRMIHPPCPNAGKACFCTGACQPIQAEDTDPRTDAEIIEASRDLAWERIIHGTP